jgi:trimethylamine--corrinoid protein Co-methyltransferase
VVTGAFTPRGSAIMIDLLAIDAGGRDALAERPRAVFDVCPSPPLTWSEFACRNVMDLARAHVPAELISMPLAGVAAPVTLIGSIVQHAAETLAGIVLHQLAEAGSPIVWGGAPTIVDMRSGSTPMGAIETAMIDAGYAAVGKSLGLPVHAYLGATDSKLIDAQAGYESGMTALIGGLAGIDMISGPGMLDFLLAQSAEKLVLDAEMIGMVQRLLRGIATPTETLATGFFEAAGPEGRFLELQETRKLFRSEQFLPSKVFDRNSRRGWLDAGGLDAYGRAGERVLEIMATHQVPSLAPEVGSSLVARVREAGAPFGLGDELPGAPAGLA